MIKAQLTRLKKHMNTLVESASKSSSISTTTHRYNWACRHCKQSVHTDSQEELREQLALHKSCGGDMVDEYARALRRKYQQLAKDWRDW